MGVVVWTALDGPRPFLVDDFPWEVETSMSPDCSCPSRSSMFSSIVVAYTKLSPRNQAASMELRELRTEVLLKHQFQFTPISGNKG